MKALPPVTLALTMMLAAQSASAQTWQSATVSRQHHGEDSLRVDLTYTAGKLTVKPAAEQRNLYEYSLRYNAQQFTPSHSFNAESRTLTIAMNGHGSRIGRMNEGNNLTLQLTPGIAMGLDLNVGAAESAIELGGLSIDRLQLRAGAGDFNLGFNAPNPIRMRELRIDVGAAGMHALHLGNSNAERIIVRAAAGGVDLDFTGQWAGDMKVSLDMAVGGADITIPRDAGVRLHTSTFLSEVGHEGMIERDGDFYSPNWDQATRKLVINSTSRLAGIEIKWIDQ